MMVRTKGLPSKRSYIPVHGGFQNWLESFTHYSNVLFWVLFVCFLSYSADKHCGEMAQDCLGTLAGVVDTRWQ